MKKLFGTSRGAQIFHGDEKFMGHFGCCLIELSASDL